MLCPSLPGSPPSPLNGVRRRLGITPRKLGWFEKAPIAFDKPEWLKSNPEDQMNEVFSAFKRLWKHGIVVWAHVVMANNRIYLPGDSDLPGEILYSLTQDDAVAVSQLLQFGDRLYRLKEAEVPDATWTEREREIAEDLASEVAWHAGFKLPDHWSATSAEYRLNSILFHRAHLPGNILAYRLLPLLVLPKLPYDALIVPQEFWTDELFAFLEAYSTNRARKGGVEKRHNELEAAYLEVFGTVDSVLHETESRHTHVDVYQFAPREGRNFWTLVSAGMSESAQPGGDGNCPQRTEVVLYCEVKTRELGELVRNTAHYPFESGQALGHGHTVSVEQTSSRIFGNDRFSAILFVAATRPEDRNLVGKVVIDGAPLSPLMMIPLMQSEFSFYQANGMDAFFEAVRKSPNSIVFHPERDSVV